MDPELQRLAPDMRENAERLIREFQDAVEDEKDAASRVAHLEGEIEDLGLNPNDYATRA